MAKMRLRYYPDEVLKQQAKKISTFDSSVRKLAQDMLETMYDSDGVGLAAETSEHASRTQGMTAPALAKWASKASAQDARRVSIALAD